MMKKLRFWVVTVLLFPLMVPICLLALGSAFCEDFFKWLVDRADCAGWAFCWLHRKLAGNTVQAFKMHMRSRRW